MPKENFSIRLDDDQRLKVRQIASDYGLKEAMVIQLAVRALVKYVEKYGVLPPMLNFDTVVSDLTIIEKARLNEPSPTELKARKQA